MHTRGYQYMIAIIFLALAMLACNVGGAAPVQDVSTTSGSDAAPADSNPAAAGTGCENPLLPTRVGATWNYQMSGTVSDTFVRSIIAADGSTFTDQDVFGTGVTRQGKWNCQNGDLVALDPPSGASASVNALAASADFHTTSNSGVTLPGTVSAGSTWTQSFVIEGKPVVNGLEVPSKNETSIACSGIGTESVTVPAGTFDAMRVDCQVNITITIDMQGAVVPTQLNMTSTSWYAPGVGMVKSISTGADLATTIELTSYTIP